MSGVSQVCVLQCSERSAPPGRGDCTGAQVQAGWARHLWAGEGEMVAETDWLPSAASVCRLMLESPG